MNEFIIMIMRKLRLHTFYQLKISNDSSEQFHLYHFIYIFKSSLAYRGFILLQMTFKLMFYKTACPIKCDIFLLIKNTKYLLKETNLMASSMVIFGPYKIYRILNYFIIGMQEMEPLVS